MDVRFLGHLVAEGVLGVARDEDHLHVGVDLAHLAHQRRPVDIGHDDVGDDEVDGLLAGLDDLERPFAVAGLDHLVALRRQRPGADHAHRVLVLDQQDGAHPGKIAGRLLFRPGGGERRFRFLAFGGLVARQMDGKRRARAELAVDGDEAAGLLDDAVGRRQSEPGALADLLGREEGLEDALEMRLGDAGAGIDHLDQHVIAGGQDLGAPLQRGREGDVGGADRQRAARGHGVPRVHREIDDDLLELSLVDLDQPEVAAVDDVELDVDADQAAQEVGQLGEHVGDVQHLGLQGLLAGEGEELAHQIGGAVGVLLDLHDVGEVLLAGGMAQEQQIAEADDHRQKVVEVVRHAAGELADGLHLLGLGELRFQVPLGGGVVGVKDQARKHTGIILHAGDGQ